MLTGLRFLLTYACNFECDHYFSYCGPKSGGTFTLEQIRAVLGEAAKLGPVELIYYDGGEPLFHYPPWVELKVGFSEDYLKGLAG